MSGTSLSVDPSFERGYEMLREDAALVKLDDVAVLELTGDDRKGWLQGQITNDLRGNVEGSSIQYCLCSPTGQLLADCGMWTLADRFIVTTDRASAPAVANRCETMVILEDVSLQDLTATHDLLSVQGPSATSALTRLLQLPTLDAGQGELEGETIWCLRSNRTGYGGWDLLLPKTAGKARARIEKSFELANDQAIEVARLEAGIPKQGADTTAKTLPPELGPAFQISHISYSKGCYTGQEVLMRIHSRGHTNRTWMGLLAEAPLEAGATIATTSRQDAGTVTSAALSPRFGFIAGAMLRNDAAQPGDLVTVQTGAGPVEAEVLHMPILLNA